MDGKNYKPEVVELVWHLQECNVAFHRIPTVIEHCLKFVGKRAKQLPTTKTINSMSVSRLAASQRQMEVQKDISYKFNVHQSIIRLFGWSVSNFVFIVT